MKDLARAALRRGVRVRPLGPRGRGDPLLRGGARARAAGRAAAAGAPRARLSYRNVLATGRSRCSKAHREYPDDAALKVFLALALERWPRARRFATIGRVAVESATSAATAALPRLPRPPRLTIVGEVVEPTFRSSSRGSSARRRASGSPGCRPEAEIAARWHLDSATSFRRAARVGSGGAPRTDAVLKLAGPWDRHGRRDRVPARWGGGPAPTLLEADEERGAILLERIAPGRRASRRRSGGRSRRCSRRCTCRDATGSAPSTPPWRRRARPRRARRPRLGAAPGVGPNALRRLQDDPRPRGARPRRLRRAQPPRAARAGASVRSTRSRAPETAPTTPPTGSTQTGSRDGARRVRGHGRGDRQRPRRLRDWCGRRRRARLSAGRAR